MSLIRLKFALASNSLLRVSIKQQCFQSVPEGQRYTSGSTITCHPYVTSFVCLFVNYVKTVWFKTSFVCIFWLI